MMLIYDGNWPWFTHPTIRRCFPTVSTTTATRAAFRSGDCESRGQVYTLDESSMTARLDANIRLGLYSFAFGSAHGIADGSLHFNSGLAGIAEEFAEMFGISLILCGIFQVSGTKH